MNPMFPMMQPMMIPPPGASGSAGSGKSSGKKSKDDNRPSGKDDTVFVGGLRKSTTEEKVLAHFSKFGQVDNVDIKRLPDGSSRGFAFVKFVEKDSVRNVIEAHASHMIDNKWVDVKPQAYVSMERSRQAERAKAGAGRQSAKEEEAAPESHDEYEAKWTEKYLQSAAAMQKGEAHHGRDVDEPASDGASKSGQDNDSPNPMGNMMNAMMNMAGMMNPMMSMMAMSQMMGGCNPMMMGGCPGCCGGCGGCGCCGGCGGCGGCGCMPGGCCGCGGCPGCGGCGGGGCCGGCPGAGGPPGGAGGSSGSFAKAIGDDEGEEEGSGGSNRYQPY